MSEGLAFRNYKGKTTMKLRQLAVLTAAFAVGNAAAQQLVDPNSTYFQVDNYYAIKPDGNYERFQIAGFRQALSPGTSALLFFLPRISVRQQDVSYFRPNGAGFDPRLQPGAEVGSITIKPNHNAAMPTPQQIPSISAALAGQSIAAFRVLPWKSQGQPVIQPEAVPFFGGQIYQDYQAYEQQLAAQEQFAQAYSAYQPRNATLQNVEVSLLIGGEVAASRTYMGTPTALGPITLLAPTEFQKNQMLEGNYEILVTSRFRDTKTSSISATFDAVQAVKSFVEETQKAITKSKSSGFQVFSLGSRKSKMNTSINQTLRTSDDIQIMEKTNVVMFDATDSMIEEFESKFFPALAKQEVIDRHLEAAAKASAEGNEDLAKVHRDYADAIRTDNQMKEVDSVAAAAALNSGDYAGFIAHGVRALNSSDRKENSFRRMVNSEVEIRQATIWDQTRTVTAMRQISVPVTQGESARQHPRIGLCGMRYEAPYQWSPYPGQFTTSQGLLVSCVEEGSPAAQAGLLPGMIVRAIGAQSVSTLGDFESALANIEPGGRIDFWVVRGPSPQSPVSTERQIRITTKRGYPNEG